MGKRRDDIRRGILAALTQPRFCRDLVKLLGTTLSSTKHMLTSLKAEGLVWSRRKRWALVGVELPQVRSRRKRRPSAKPIEEVRRDNRLRTQVMRAQNTGYYLYELARKRADVRLGNVPFSLLPGDVIVPERCPIVGLPFVRDQSSPLNPTLERIDPEGPWSRFNIRVVSAAAAEFHTWDQVTDQGEAGRVYTPEELVMFKESLRSFKTRTESEASMLKGFISTLAQA